MSNIANVFKSEISRVARKELRDELKNIKKAVATYRSQIAELKRQVKQLQQDVKKVSKAGKQGTPQSTPAASSSDSGGTLRFSAKGFAAQRKRLDLPVVAVAKIIGVSPQSVTNWESGKTRPRASQLVAIAALRKMGKKEAAARLAA